MYSYGPPHMAKQKQDDQLELTYNSYVRTQDVTLKTCQMRWIIGRSSERGSGISVLAARHDDEDNRWKVHWDAAFWINPESSTSQNRCCTVTYPHLINQPFGGARGVMVIVARCGHNDTSSNPGRAWLHSTNTLGKGMNPNILLPAMGK